MFHSSPFRFAFVLLALLVSSVCLQAASKDKTKLRVICVSALPADQGLVLASRDEKGKWKELGKVDLRPSTVTDWLAASTGELHLATGQGSDLKSVCEFRFPAGASRALVALIANPDSSTYTAHVFEPAKAGFEKGTVMVVNASGQAAQVSLGSNEKTLDAGKDEVIRPAGSGDGTYRVQVSHVDKDGKKVLCHDRHVSASSDSREMLFLLPDKTLVLKVVSLPIFGSLD